MYRFGLVLSLLIFLVPSLVSAQGLVACTGLNCGTCEFAATVKNAYQFLILLLSIVATIILVYVGLVLVTSAASESAKTQAKTALMNIVFGLILVIAAGAIIDTVMRVLVKDTLLNWDDPPCLYAITPSSEVVRIGTSAGLAEGAVLTEQCELIGPEIFDCSKLVSECEAGGGKSTVDTSDPSNHRVSCNYPASVYGGSCNPVTDPNNPCHADNLTMFGSRAAEASIICNKESGGAPVRSGSDRCCGPGGNCSGAPSFSGGYLQINVLAHADKIPNCSPGAFYSKNCVPGKKCGTQGSCVKRNSEGICIGWSCSITNTSMYNECMKVTTNDKLNFEISEQLFSARGQRFNDWSWSARRCNIPY